MRRRTLATIATFLVLFLLVAGTFLGLLRYEPRWYKAAVLPPGEQRTNSSQAFLKEFHEFVNSTADPRWFAQFTDEQINSFLEEGFKNSGLAAKMLPEDISDPRVTLEPEKLRLAFRYGRGTWSTVVSIETRIWLPRQEPNVAALELIGFQLGALPISVQSLLERVSEVGRASGIEVTWYRVPETGHPVAILRFQADQARATVQLESVRIEQGKITITGRSLDGGAALPTTRDLAALFPNLSLHPAE